MSIYRHLDYMGRIRLSSSFFLRDFLQSEIGAAFGVPNIPDNLELAVHAGRKLCEDILEPLNATFGRIHIRSGYRSSRLNAFGNARGLNCSSNEKTFADHIWDRRDAHGNAGACACIVIPWFLERHRADEWERLAWFLHDNLDYHRIVFFGRQAALNVGWRENPAREIMSHTAPRGRLTGPGMLNGWGDHPDQYPGFPEFRMPAALQPVAKSAAAVPTHCIRLHPHRETACGDVAKVPNVTHDRRMACDGASSLPQTQTNEGLLV